MSKITNPNTEASVSCGFFNSNYDRYYDAAQMSRIFDGIINDGVFATVGDALVVNAESGTIVNVGTGKCWFNHTWTENDAILPVECEISEVLLDRIDAVIVEVNNDEEVRDNFIKVIKGTPSSSPVRPTLANENSVHQYALCYIYRAAGSTEITQSDITNVVGTDETPFVTGILDVVSLDALLGKWQDELDKFVAGQEEEFNEWFERMKDQLTEDAAGSLQTQIVEHKETKATADTLGHVMLSDSSAVTDSTGLALPATEKNASIPGTLGYQIVESTTASTGGLDANTLVDKYIQGYGNGMTNTPNTNGWFENRPHVVAAGYNTQTFIEIGTNKVYKRHQTNGVFSDWEQFSFSSYDLLYTNPSPTSVMSALILLTDTESYDYLDIEFVYHVSNLAYRKTMRVTKNSTLIAQFIAFTSTNHITVATRNFTFGYDGEAYKLAVGEGTTQTEGYAKSINNEFCIPYRVYGGKYNNS